MCEPKNFYVWLLQFIGLLGLLALILWLSLRPKPPSYSIDYIFIPQSSAQNGSIIYNLEIDNPNKESSIFFDDITLSFRGALKPLVNAMSNATAELKAALMTRFRYKTWGIKSKFHGVNLHGTLPIGPDGKLSGKKKKYPIKSPSKKTARFKTKH